MRIYTTIFADKHPQEDPEAPEDPEDLEDPEGWDQTKTRN